jgi:hypothetical protein
MLELVLYNITGQVIRSSEALVHKGANLVPLNLENLPGGPYFLQIRSSEGGTVTKKVSVTE